MVRTSMLRRPVRFLSRRLVRRHVVFADIGLGVPVGDTLEHMIPRSVLEIIAPGAHLERDMLNLLTVMRSDNRAHGSRKIGVEWSPPGYLRGMYARAALYIADIGPQARNVVDDLAMPIDLAIAWDREYPSSARVRDRTVALAVAQGPFVLRGDGAAMAWRRADPVEILFPGPPLAPDKRFDI